MVSTRQMSNVGGGPSSSDGPVDAGPSRPTRHNSVIATVASVTMPTVAGPSTLQTVPVKPPRNLLSLPHEVLEKIFVYLGYNKIAQMRTISHQMNQVCSSVLNSTFQRLQTQMLVRFQAIKAKMPRRESARRSHPLACESDIVETLHMRLTLLHMTFGKHIERKHCCFFPGEILDEVYRILHYIKITQKLARPYKVTDELFDLSTMAMEYFKENIEPKLPEIVYFGSEFLDFTGTFSSTTSKNYMCLDTNTINMNGDSKCEEGSRSPPGSPDDRALVTPPPPQSNMVLRKRIRKIKQGMKMYNNQLSVLRHDLRSCKRKTAEQQKQISEQQKQLAEQQKQTLEYATRLDDNDKKNEETSRKFSTLLQELNKCKTELQYWRSKSPTTPQVCTSCGTTITPLAQEDLEALVNQGVKPDDVGLAMDGPSSDFIPIVGNEESLGTELWEGIELVKVAEVVEEKEVKIGSPRASHSGVKRKMEEQIAPSLAQGDPTPSKKSKRGLKTRCGKVRNK